MDGAPEDERVALLRAHPDLAGKAALANELTAESTFEQARAGLDALTADELRQFTELNAAYRQRFDCEGASLAGGSAISHATTGPFILAVRNASKRAILASFERSVRRSPLCRGRRTGAP